MSITRKKSTDVEKIYKLKDYIFEVIKYIPITEHLDIGKKIVFYYSDDKFFEINNENLGISFQILCDSFEVTLPLGMNINEFSLTNFISKTKKSIKAFVESGK